MANEQKTRKEMDPRWMWDLTAVYPNEEAFEAAMENAKELTEKAKAR